MDRFTDSGPGLRIHPRILESLLEFLQHPLGSIPVIGLEGMDVAISVGAGDAKALR
jgi:hypothetical protein